MGSEDATPAEYGNLERWTIALFALSVVFSLFATVPGTICLICSRFWSTSEKLIGFFAPPLLAVGLVFAVAGGDTMQDWIRIPLMFTVAGISQFGTAAYLYFRARARRATAILAS